MADVTIGQLNQGIPNKNTAVIPYSDGSTTYKTSPSGIVAASPGCILQVKQVVRTSIFTHNFGQIWVDVPTLSAYITPSSTSSKFLINWSGSCSVSYNYGTGTQVSALKVVRVINGISSDTILGDSRGSALRAGTTTYVPGNQIAATHSGMYLDSPSLTNLNEICYKLQMWAEDSSAYNSVLGGSFNSNLSYSSSVPTFLTVQEIAG